MKREFALSTMLSVAVVSLVSVMGKLQAQNIYLPLNDPAYHTTERLSLLEERPVSLHSSIKPWRREDVVRAALDHIDHSHGVMRHRLTRLLMDNNEFVHLDTSTSLNPERIEYVDSTRTFYVRREVHRDTVNIDLSSKSSVGGIFYRTPAHFFEFDSESFYLRVNPLLRVSIGAEKGDDDPLFVNKRGIEIRGGVDKKVFFATNIIETQLRPPSYVRRWIDEFKAIPDAGFFKSFRSGIFNFEDAYDYLSSNGYLGFNISEHVGVQIGHGKNFIGEGYRSLLLSDFAKNYFFLKLNTRVWKLHYQNIFAELSAAERTSSLVPFPKKYLAAHYLSIKPGPTWSFGLFETVIFARDNNGFELQYLNPVILYRSIEHHVGSPDNVLIGLNAHWDPVRSLRLYGQVVFDEFKFSEFFSDRGWWGNKYAAQIGAKYMNAFNVEMLDVQVEYNRARPYTYSHYDSTGSYAHFNQPLAHPLGANFSEVVVIARYQPLNRLLLTGKLFLIDTAEDTEEEYYGSNILRPSTGRVRDYGVDQGQGIAANITIFSFQARYMLKHNFFIEAEFFLRDYESDDPVRDLLTRYASLGIRWNLFDGQMEF